MPGCCAVGSAPALGAGGREFESRHSDMNKTHGLTLQNSSFRGFFFVLSDLTSLLDAAGAGRIACFHGFLVAGEQDLILLCRQVRAAGQVELFAVHIADSLYAK